MEEDSKSSVRDSFIYPEREQNRVLRFLKQFDFFSFVPVPKDQPISTKRSIIGSTIFIVLIFSYIIVDFYQFLTKNPPIVQNAQSTIDQEFYTLPRVAITFMQGQSLNQTRDYSEYMSLSMTKQLKDNSIKNSTPINLELNNYTYMQDWLGNKTLSFYTQLLTPAEEMKARGLLYSTQNSNYTKITITLCDLNKQESNCTSFENMASLLAKGRIFLFIEDMEDASGISVERVRPNKYRIANFFLIPRLYKRVTVEFKVINTVVLPDYFFHFSQRTYTRLELFSISQQTSDTSINDKERGRESLELLGITFQLAAEVLDVRVTYTTFLDHVAKWGAFFNVLFAAFAIYFFTYNKKKFYKKNPDWDRFKHRPDQVSNINQTTYS